MLVHEYMNKSMSLPIFVYICFPICISVSNCLSSFFFIIIIKAFEYIKVILGIELTKIIFFFFQPIDGSKENGNCGRL